jgi:hypothetical protein
MLFLVLFPAVVLVIPVADVIDFGSEEIAKQFDVKSYITVIFPIRNNTDTELKDVVCLPPTELHFNRLVGGDLAIILDVILLLNPGTLERIPQCEMEPKHLPLP